MPWPRAWSRSPCSRTAFSASSTRPRPRGFSLSVSYWRDDESIRRWKQNAEHLIAQKLGKEKWYPAYAIKVARVDRAYSQGV